MEPPARLPASRETEADKAVHSSSVFEPTRQSLDAQPLNLDVAATQPSRVDAEEVVQAVDVWARLPEAGMAWEERADDLSAEVIYPSLLITSLCCELLLLGDPDTRRDLS